MRQALLQRLPRCCRRLNGDAAGANAAPCCTNARAKGAHRSVAVVINQACEPRREADCLILVTITIIYTGHTVPRFVGII
jgi:hypothetical protein